MEIINSFLRNNYKKLIIITVIIICVSFFYYISQQDGKNSENISSENINYVKIAGKNIKVELALTKESQNLGLSGRKELKENEGMLFAFDKPQKNYFWMKDMQFPIDMIWIDQDLKVIFIEKNVSPESYPKTFGPSVKSRYVLEVNALFSEKNNLKIGNSVIFLP